MAVSKNLYTRGLKQRLAGAVWYQRKGETVVRELAPAVSNPQTDKQMQQRAMLANLVSMYRANRFWMNFGAFEGKKQSWSDYNAFVSANSKVKPVYLTQAMASNGAAIVLPYTVTKGTLPTVRVFEYEPNNTFGTDLYAEGIDLDDTGATTVAALSSALLASNNGLMESDQLSIIVNYQGVTEIGDPYVTARAYEFIIDTSDGRTLASLDLAGILLTDEVESGLNSLVIAINSETTQVGVTMVVSRTAGSAIKVSTQTLAISTAQQNFIADYQTTAAYNTYVDSYGAVGAQNFLSAGYSSKRSSQIALPKDITRIEVEAQGGWAVGQGPIEITEANKEVILYFTSDIGSDDTVSPSASYNTVYIDAATEELRREALSAPTLIDNGQVYITLNPANKPYQLESVGLFINGRAVTASFRTTYTGAQQD